MLPLSKRGRVRAIQSYAAAVSRFASPRSYSQRDLTELSAQLIA